MVKKQEGIAAPWQERYPGVTCVPRHLAIVMDGNGRWARARGWPRLAGHRAGTDNIRRVLTAATDFGVQVLTLYAFSTENWGRPPDEVNGLMSLLGEVIQRELDDLNRNGVCIRHCGRTDGISPWLQAQIRQAVETTRNNTRIVLNVAFNYGGRREILDAMCRVLELGHRPDEITEELLSAHLYTAGLPDPDLIVRTGGEYRLSNFLLWQSAYAEYYATPTFWPDFDEKELAAAFEAYSARERRFGKVPGTGSGC